MYLSLSSGINFKDMKGDVKVTATDFKDAGICSYLTAWGNL
jgi:hypothetical protein